MKEFYLMAEAIFPMKIYVYDVLTEKSDKTYEIVPSNRSSTSILTIASPMRCPSASPFETPHKLKIFPIFAINKINYFY